MHASNPLERDKINLFKNNNIHVNDMRDFFAENVCETLDDTTTPTTHNEAANHIFDKWYRSLRKTIWTNAAKYALVNNDWTPEEAEQKAASMYRDAYRKIDKKRRKEMNHEN